MTGSRTIECHKRRSIQRLASWCLVVAPLCIVFALGLSGHADAATHQVEMIDEAPYFKPKVLEIQVGDTVEWLNQGPEGIHIVSDRDQAMYSGDVPVDASWSHEFKYAGEYTVICGRHFFMRSKIVVRNADGTTEPVFDHPYQAAFREFTIPTRNGIPRMIINDAHSDTMWFTIGGGDFYGFEGIPPQNKIVEVDAAGNFIEFSTPTPGGDGSEVGVDSLVQDDEGNIWFTERISNRIGKLTRDGDIVEYDIGREGGYALGVDIAPDGKVWFAERYGNRIGWIDAEGNITEIEMPEPDSEPRTVYVDTKGLVWYTARVANEVGYYNPRTESFHRIQIPTKLARPAGIAETSDGTIYFVEMVGNKIAKVVGDRIVEYAIPTAFTAPFKIVADADDKLWFTEVFGNAIGRFDPETGEFDEFIIPTEDSRPGGIAIGDDGNIWFVEQKGNKVGYIDLGELERITNRSLRAKTGRDTEKERRPVAISSESPPRERHDVLVESKIPASFPDRTAETKALSWKIEDFPLPTVGGYPANALTEDGNGRIWFPQMFGNKIAALDPETGLIREIELPKPLSMPTAVALDGKTLWSTQFRANSIAKLNLDTGKIEEYPLPNAGALPSSLTVGKRGKVWFTQLALNSIASFDPRSKTFEEFAMPRAESGPLDIAYDGKGFLWITASSVDSAYLARFDTRREKFMEIDVPSPGAAPVGLLVEDTAVWTTLGNVGKIGRYDLPSGEWREYKVPSAKSAPFQLARGVDGRIWMTDGGGFGTDGANQIAVLDPDTGRFTQYPVNQPRAKPSGILVSSAGDVWFTQKGANAVSRLVLQNGDSNEVF